MFHQPAVGDYLLNERREGFGLVALARGFVKNHTLAQIARYNVARRNSLYCLGAFEYGQAYVYGIAVKDSRKAVGNNQAYAARLYRDGRVLRARSRNRSYLRQL